MVIRLIREMTDKSLLLRYVTLVQFDKSLLLRYVTLVQFDKSLLLRYVTLVQFDKSLLLRYVTLVQFHFIQGTSRQHPRYIIPLAVNKV